MDVTGQVMSTFTDVKSPYYLSLDSKGHVLVADYQNDRILLLSTGSQLQLQYVLVDNTTSQVKLRLPEQLYYNELASQLYVVQSNTQISLFTVH